MKAVVWCPGDGVEQWEQGPGVCQVGAKLYKMQSSQESHYLKQERGFKNGVKSSKSRRMRSEKEHWNWQIAMVLRLELAVSDFMVDPRKKFPKNVGSPDHNPWSREHLKQAELFSAGHQAKQ